MTNVYGKENYKMRQTKTAGPQQKAEAKEKGYLSVLQIPLCRSEKIGRKYWEIFHSIHEAIKIPGLTDNGILMRSGESTKGLTDFIIVPSLYRDK